jgi:23S rRNA pseudouridine1911/1915/1917 synthase
VHRLDKETSGVLIIAKNSESFIKLKQQFMERTIKKTYLALVHGEVKQEGEINAPLGRQTFNRKRFGVMAGGREAVTNYKVVSNFQFSISKNQSEALTLLEVAPQTGRTHQIRVHLKHINHPIFSDELYGGRKQARDDRKILPRLFLHAKSLEFYHPSTGEKMVVDAPLSSDLEEFLLNQAAVS